jgi:site-specific DNA-methyltransferase (adenine-specific)
MEDEKLVLPTDYPLDDQGRPTILITDIVIGDRMERDLGDVNQMVESIKEFGILNAVIIDQNNVLIAGMRRTTAASILGMERVPFVRLGPDWDEYELQCVELIENLHRKDLSWSERDIQIATLHKTRQKLYGTQGGGATATRKVRGWGLADTSKITGTSVADISLAVKVAEAIQNDPSLAAEASRANALQTLKRREMQKIRAILASRATEEVSCAIVNMDCLEFLQTLDSESVSLVVTDFPYGTNMESLFAGTIMRDEFTRFQDDYAKSMETIKKIRDELYRVMLPNSVIYAFCGFLQAKDILFYYSELFCVRAVPIIWDKITPGYTANKGKAFAFNWEPLLMMWKNSMRDFNEGEGIILPHEGDVISRKKVIGKDKMGVNEKPVDLLEQLILLSSNPGELVIDPFCGSGSTLEAAAKHERLYKGCDNNNEVVIVAKARLFNYYEGLKDKEEKEMDDKTLMEQDYLDAMEEQRLEGEMNDDETNDDEFTDEDEDLEEEEEDD